MIATCPNCGHSLRPPLIDGISICPTCRYDFSDNVRDRLMSASWTCLRNNPATSDVLRRLTKSSEAEAILVAAYMIDHCFTVEEFGRALKELGITKKT